MHPEEVIVCSLVPTIIFIAIAVCFYFGRFGIRAHVRRKSWCRKMGYKLVKKFNENFLVSYDYMGLDSDGNYHEIPDHIYPDNHVTLYPF